MSRDVRALLEQTASEHVLERLRTDTGGDLEEIASLLKKTEICPACLLESQERSCCSLETQKIGRRLSRLIERAK